MTTSFGYLAAIAGVSNMGDNWDKLAKSPTLERNGPWLLKFASSDLRIWINELNKRKTAKREQLYKGHWRVVAERVDGKWKQVKQ